MTRQTIIDTPGKFSRVCGEQVPDSRYADPIERPEPRIWSPAFEAFCFILALGLLAWMFFAGMATPDFPALTK